MKPIHTYFDRTVLINLQRRSDRLQRTNAKCDLIGLKFEVVKAIDAKDTPIPSFVFSTESQNRRFTPGAYALAITTKNIIKKAMEDEMDSILIMEDDIQWHPESNSVFHHAYRQMPSKWDCLMLSAENREMATPFSSHLSIAKRSFLCSAYALHHSVFEEYHHFLSHCDKPIDNWMVNTLQPRNHVFVTSPVLATQIPDFSDISNSFENWKTSKFDNSNLPLL